MVDYKWPVTKQKNNKNNNNKTVAWLYGVHRTCAQTAAVSCGTSHASAVTTLTTLVDIQKRAMKS